MSFIEIIHLFGVYKNGITRRSLLHNTKVLINIDIQHEQGAGKNQISVSNNSRDLFIDED